MTDLDTKPDPNADAPIEQGRNSKWLWVAMIVLIAVAAIIVFLNPTGEEEPLPDSAVTTQEERLNTDLTDEEELTEEAMEDVRGTDQVLTVEAEEEAIEEANSEDIGEIVTDPGGTVER